jgi:hypothetical protein
MPTRYLLCESAPAGIFERRKEPRRMAFNIAAEVRASELASPLVCTVRNVSESGARLEIDRDDGRLPQMDVALPERIDVYFCTESRLIPCRLAWQDGRHFGVEFIGEEWDNEQAAPGDAA